MKELLKLGFSECTIDEMLNQNPNIKDITYEELYQKIDILKNIGCSEEQVLNIIGSNPMYLDRSNNDVIKLLAFLDKLGFSVLSILIDSNPYILNLDVFEIDDYVKSRLSNGELLEDIVDDLDTNAYLFNEI